MISRSLGPEFGGSIGLMFFLAKVCACGEYVLGLVEAILDVFGSDPGMPLLILSVSYALFQLISMTFCMRCHHSSFPACLHLSQSPLCLWECRCFPRVTGTRCSTPPSSWCCVWSCAWWAPTSTHAPPSPSCCWSPYPCYPSSSAQWWSNVRILSSPTSYRATRPSATTPATLVLMPPLWGTTWAVSVRATDEATAVLLLWWSHCYMFFLQLVTLWITAPTLSCLLPPCLQSCLPAALGSWLEPTCQVVITVYTWVHHYYSVCYM